jgi:putative DNA primase/helicase
MIERKQRKTTLAKQLLDAPSVTPELAKVSEALKELPCKGAFGKDDWDHIVDCVFVATKGSEQGFHIADEWSREWLFYDNEAVRIRWAHRDKYPPDNVNANSLFELVAKKAEQKQMLTELSRLDLLEYDRQRERAATLLGVRAPTLDKVMVKLREEDELECVTEGFLQPVEPWPEPVDSHELLCELRNVLRSHVVMTESSETAICLWILHAHALDAAQHSPILDIRSPTMRCGKSQLLNTIARFVPKPLPAANVTPATIFRAVHRWQPTMLIDEVDTFVADKSELRGILNSGHKRELAFVIRCVGEELTPTQFSTWCPKVFAHIGTIHPTLVDRSICIELKRKLKTEKVTRIPKDPSAYRDLLRKCARWALDNVEAVRAAKVEMPDALNDRAQDNWETLLAIAEHSGPEWTEAARNAALQLSSGEEDATEAIELLRDIKEVFDRHHVEALSSDTLAYDLREMQGHPWAEFKDGHAITQSGIASLLKPFKIRPRQVRIGTRRLQGYQLAQFKWAFKRYLP